MLRFRELSFLPVIIIHLLITLQAEDNKVPTTPKGLSKDEKTVVTDLIKKYFDLTDIPEKQKLLNEFSKYDNRVSKNDLTYLTDIIWPLTKKGPKHNGKQISKCSHPDYSGEYLINIPKSAQSGAKVGIFIGLHGGGQNVGDARQIQRMFGIPNPKFITVYPTVIKKDSAAWTTEREKRYVMEIIAELKRTYNIDTNQIYLAGHSMGCGGIWVIGSDYADIFASLGAMAGYSHMDLNSILNLKNTPIWFYHSTDDSRMPVEQARETAKTLKEYKEKYGPFDYIYKEYTDIGHGSPKEGLKPIWDWMFSKKRNPYPKFIIWQTTHEYINTFYWLKLNTYQAGQIKAQIDDNKIIIDSTIDGLTIFLNEKLIDFSKEVIVKVNDTEKFKGPVNYSISALIESIDDKKDPEMYFVGKIRIE